MKVEVFESVEACSGLADSWNAFAATCGDDVSLNYEWHHALAVSQPALPVRVVWVSENGEPIAILPTRSTPTKLRGVPLRQIAPLGSAYCAHDCLLVRPNSLETIEAVLDAAADALPSWDVFSFSASEDSGIYKQLETVVSGTRKWVEWADGKQSPYLALASTFEEFQRNLSTKRRTGIRSRVKKLKERGKIHLRVITDPNDVADGMDMVRRIELASWKEPAGTSITANPYQLVFYDDLTRGLAERGWLRLFVLLLDGAPIAHDLGFVYKDRFYSGKTSFVEDFRSVQPGFVLRWMILGDLHEQGIREHDFMGDPDPYKLHWTDSMRLHRNVKLLRRGARTSLARLLRFPRRRGAMSLPTARTDGS